MYTPLWLYVLGLFAGWALAEVDPVSKLVIGLVTGIVAGIWSAEMRMRG